MKTIEERIIKEVKMATTIQDLEERVNALYNSVLQIQANLNPVIDKSDDAYNKCPQVDTNTMGVSDNDIAICDIAEMVDTNSQAIDDLAELVDELLNGGN